MKTAIIGGGASGMTAAVFSARNGKKVTVFERSDRILKKLLATGNGRCNLSNEDISAEFYITSSPKTAEGILRRFSAREESEFFASLGIPFACEDGRIYPRSKRAAAVSDALRFEADKLGVRIKTNAYIKEIRPERAAKLCFRILGESFDRVIIACGGSAAPMFGTDGNAFKLLQSVGHTIHAPRPMLVPLKTRENTAQIKGIRAACTVSANGRSEQGEVQFTDYGLSGIAVMQLSSLFDGRAMPVSIDLIPETGLSELQNELASRAAMLRSRTAEDFMTGVIHKTLFRYILGRCKIPPHILCGQLQGGELALIAKMLKSLDFTAVDTCGFSNAQTTRGGAELSEFSPSTLESKKCGGIFCVGEALDCAGLCGGYNLHWAWLTGYLAGNA